MAAWLFTLAAAAQELPQAVDLIQRIDQLYPWLDVAAFDVDAQGNLYLAGGVQGAIPATVNLRFGPLGGRDMVVIKLDPDGRQIYGTAVGGTGEDFVGGIKVDSAGNLYLSGSTSSVDYPALPSQGSSSDEVLLKLDATGNILFNTRLAWAGAILGMDVDAAGAVYIGGIPKAGQLPVTPGAYRQASDGSGGFIAKLNGSGGQLAAATYIEGQVANLMLRGNGDVLFSMGQTIAALDGSLSQLVFSTTTDLATDITNIGRDGSDNVYAATPAGYRKYASDGQQLLLKRDFTGASFPQFAVTPSGTVFLFGSAPPNYPTFHETQSCGPDLMEPISNAPPGTYGFLMVIGPDGDSQYATFMAEEIPLYLPIRCVKRRFSLCLDASVPGVGWPGSEMAGDRKVRSRSFAIGAYIGGMPGAFGDAAGLASRSRNDHDVVWRSDRSPGRHLFHVAGWPRAVRSRRGERYRGRQTRAGTLCAIGPDQLHRALVAADGRRRECRYASR